ncbi:MAG: GNAT family N-acetyltransferase [Maricaulaceae bacterium]
MDVAVKPINALSAAEKARWDALQASHPGLSSPYFTRGYAEAIASARRDARAAVIREGAEIVGFLPFQRSLSGYCRPLGGPMADVHGLIAPPDAGLELKTVLRKAHIPVFVYFGAPAEQAAFAPSHRKQQRCHVCDLSDGFDAYHARKKASHGSALSRLRNKRSKLVRRVGEPVITLDDRRETVFDTLWAWKSAQYKASGYVDLTETRWAMAALRAMFETRTPEFAGVLSTLEVEGRPIAIHFGIKSGQAIHYWFPAYDPEYAAFSPGLILLWAMLEGHQRLGVTAAHLGPVDLRYKLEFADTGFDLAKGWAHSGRTAQAGLRAAAKTVERWAEAAPLGPVSRLPGKVIRRLDQMAAYAG